MFEFKLFYLLFSQKTDESGMMNKFFTSISAVTWFCTIVCAHTMHVQYVIRLYRRISELEWSSATFTV